MAFSVTIDELSFRPEGAGLVCEGVYEHFTTWQRRAPQSSCRENAGSQDDHAVRALEMAQ